MKDPQIKYITIGKLDRDDQAEALRVFKTPENLKLLVVTLADGNIGALRVCSDLAKEERYELLQELHDKGLRGPTIWVAYKDIGGETYDGLEEAVLAADITERLAALGY